MKGSTGDYVFWKMYPANWIQRGIGGEKKNEGDEVKGNLLFFFVFAIMLWCCFLGPCS